MFFMAQCLRNVPTTSGNFNRIGLIKPVSTRFWTNFDPVMTCYSDHQVCNFHQRITLGDDRYAPTDLRLHDGYRYSGTNLAPGHQQPTTMLTRLWLVSHESYQHTAAETQLTPFSRISWMKMNKFRLRFHWSLFPRVHLIIFQHWFR